VVAFDPDAAEQAGCSPPLGRNALPAAGFGGFIAAFACLG
jgi:hypothetical protein